VLGDKASDELFWNYPTVEWNDLLNVEEVVLGVLEIHLEIQRGAGLSQVALVE